MRPLRNNWGNMPKPFEDYVEIVNGYKEFSLRVAIIDAKNALGEARTKQIIAEELER